MRIGAVQIVAMAMVALAATTSACVGAATSPSQSPAFSQTDLKIGAGDPVAGTANLTVNYTGWLYDPTKTDFKGLQFDTTTGATPSRLSREIVNVVAERSFTPVYRRVPRIISAKTSPPPHLNFH